MRLPYGRADNEPLRLVWSGRHIASKALPLALQALTNLPDAPAVYLHVLGEGPVTEGVQTSLKATQR